MISARGLTKHNAGEVTHTSKYRPWKLRTYIAFSDEKRAFAFEKYLKSASGRAFAKKRSDDLCRYRMTSRSAHAP